LKSSGRFVLHFRDGVLRVLKMREQRSVIEEGTDGPIERRFKLYDPERGAYVSEYRHLATGQIYEYTGYVYTGPLLRLVMQGGFQLERSIRLDEGSFVDVFIRR
jgi:hypothetical protein